MKILAWIVAYLIFSLLAGVLVGKFIKFGAGDDE
jgi:hypothetical protein